jgi:diguanylate cyclase (GGDEF)-like protein
MMIRWPVPAAHVYPAFAGLLALLYVTSGPWWAFQVGCLATIVGLLALLLSTTLESKLAFAAGLILVWVLFGIISAIHRRYQTACNHLQEDCDRLDLDISRLTSDLQGVEADVEDYRARIPAYHRLQAFTDDLIGAYSRQEMVFRVRRGLQDMFPKCDVLIEFFPQTNNPSPEDIWGHRAMESSQPLLCTARIRPTPSWSGRFVFLPLKIEDAMAGWVGLESREGAEAFNVQDLRLAGIAVNIVSLALGNAELYAQTQALAMSDSLTGLYTQGYFHERFDEEFSKAKHKGLPLSLLLLDVDYFKRVNDSHGHHIGDEILKWLSRQIASEVRETDFVARYGGDEFVVLMPLTGGTDALDFGRRLCGKVGSAVFRWGQERIRLTISGGVASLGESDPDKMALFHRADAALYQAKDNGRNQVVKHQ